MTEQSYDTTMLECSLQLACILDDLKMRIRTGCICWRIRCWRLVSVSEHSHSCLLSANILHPIYPDRDKINLARVNQMLIWHEIGETIIGDIPIIDKLRYKNKADAERKAWRKLLKGLPYEQEVYDLLVEFDEHKTPDAKFAYYIDKLEALKTMKRYYDMGKFHRLKWTLAHSKEIADNDTIQQLVKDGAKTPVDIWFAAPFIPFPEDEFFMEATRIIKEMDTNIQPPASV